MPTERRRRTAMAERRGRHRRTAARFSLRARLLLAVAIVALVGLVVADLATYAALKSFLVDRIDSSLDIREPAADQPAHRADATRRGTSASDAADRAALAAAAPGAYVELRDAGTASRS